MAEQEILNELKEIRKAVRQLDDTLNALVMGVITFEDLKKIKRKLGI